MRVLVTGGGGCIGAWVMKLLLDRGIEVLMYDVRSDPGRSLVDSLTEQISRK